MKHFDIYSSSHFLWEWVAIDILGEENWVQWFDFYMQIGTGRKILHSDKSIFSFNEIPLMLLSLTNFIHFLNKGVFLHGIPHFLRLFYCEI